MHTPYYYALDIHNVAVQISQIRDFCELKLYMCHYQIQAPDWSEFDWVQLSTHVQLPQNV